MPVSLRPLGDAERKSVLTLHVAPDQQDFLASNAQSLEEAAENPECVPLAVYSGDESVGFAMYARDSDDHNYWIYRLMIDARFQGQGLGPAALRALMALMFRLHGCTSIYLGVEPENLRAAAIYRRHGFRDTGQRLGNEIVMRCERPAPTG
jgi:diamine N-acetyltransferase